MQHRAKGSPRWGLVLGPAPRRQRLALAVGLAAALAGPAGAQTVGPGTFINVVSTEGHTPVKLAVAQVVRVGRVDGYTVIDTAAWVQQRTVEPAEAVARRLTTAGQRLVALTDPSNTRVWLAVDRVVIVRESQEQHAAGARTAIVMVGLRYGRDLAVRESVEEVMAAMKREAP